MNNFNTEIIKVTIWYSLYNRFIFNYICVFLYYIIHINNKL